MSSWIGLVASIAAVVLLVFCALLERHLAAMQVQLNSLTSDIRRLEAEHHSLLVRFMYLPKSRRGRKPSSQSSDTLKGNMTASIQPVESELT
jgi:hypothetical protein